MNDGTTNYCPECAKREAGWISVKDRLPNESGRYMVLINNYVTIMNWGYCYLSHKFGLVKVHDGWENSELNAPVSHWMPLPEPPK